jgi:addiction module RelE/StbE family toxin
VLKQLRKAPQHITVKLMAWVADVEQRCVEEVRKVPGYNDHPLKGDLAGKRAIRLSLQWRAVYEIRTTSDGELSVEFIDVQEVHPHAY